MSERATAVTPALLVWARERAGLSLGEAAKRLNKAPEVLAAWESGEQAPTFSQLEALADRLYRRPVAVFFLPKPPDEDPARHEFRSLPDADLDALTDDTRFALRDARAYQQSLRELTGGRNPAGRLVTRDLHPRVSDGVENVATSIREYLGVSLSDQQSWRSAADAMGHWRDAVEQVGVFVFKRSFKQRGISGFCLADPVFPVIIVNNSTPFTRQIFTTLHELAHLLYGVSSVTTSDTTIVDRFAAPDRAIEMACNRLAAEIVLPSHTVSWEDAPGGDLEQRISELANRFKVSREVVLRRLLDRRLVDQETYDRLAQKWNTSVEDDEGSSGGNYYATRAAYLGRSFLDLTFAQYRAGNVSLADMAEHLNIKARNVLKLEDYLLRKA